MISQWNNTFFKFSLIIEGTTEKVLQFIIRLLSIYNKNLGFIEHNCIFEHYIEIQTIKTLLTDIYNKNLSFIEHKYFFEHYIGIQTIKTLLTDKMFVTKKNF